MAKPTKNAKIGNEVKGAAPTPTPVPPAATSPARTTTTVRNTPVPKGPGTPVPAATTRREITHDMIARRAYEISQSPACGCEFDNWIRAERELRGEI